MSKNLKLKLFAFPVIAGLVASMNLGAGAQSCYTGYTGCDSSYGGVSYANPYLYGGTAYNYGYGSPYLGGYGYGGWNNAAYGGWLGYNNNGFCRRRGVLGGLFNWLNWY